MSETETTQAPEPARPARAPKSAGARTLADRMAGAMAALKAPPKNGRMTLQGKAIPYTTNDDLMEALRPALAAHGVAFSVDVLDVRKGISDPVAVMLRVRLACAEEELVAQAYGEGRTYAIAQTYATKYWLLRTFLVGSGEDDEVANVPLEPSARPRPQAAPAQTGERRVNQTGPSREAPATAYREDEGRRAMMRRLRDLLYATCAQGLEGEQATAIVRSVLVSLSEDGMVPLVDGEPDLRVASNDQLQRLLAWAESQADTGEAAL